MLSSKLYIAATAWSMDMSSKHMNVSDEVKLANQLPLGLSLAKLEWALV